MSDEHQGTLTLDALLGLSDEPSPCAPTGDERALEPASDLLLDLMGVAPDLPEVPLTLETLPTLPKIPQQGPVEAPRADPASKLDPASVPDRQPDVAQPVRRGQGEPAKPRVAPTTAYARRGKHASDRAKERAFGGKHAVRAAQEALPKPSAATSVTEPAPTPEPARKPEPAPTPTRTPEPAPASGPEPTPAPEPASVFASQTESSRLERLNALSRKIESEIIAASNVGERLLDECPQREQPLPDWSRGGGEASPMFDEHPQSIAEGMKEGLLEHYRLVRIKVAVGIAASLALIALALGAVAQCSGADEGQEPAPEAPSASSEIADPAESKLERTETPDKSDRQSGAAQTEDRSGTVVYRYLTTDASGYSRTVTEEVAFGSNGLCETSTMDVEFGDAEGAEAFAENVRRDYGSAARSVEVGGVKVHVEIDASANKLDREGYEDALRDSVRELSIVKKS